MREKNLRSASSWRFLAPALQQVEITFLQFGDHARDIGWIVLQIAVQGGDELTAGGIDTGLHGRGLAEVAPHANDAHMGAVLLSLGSQRLVSAVMAAIVDTDQLPGTRIAGQTLMHRRDRGRDVRLLLVHRYDDG